MPPATGDQAAEVFDGTVCLYGAPTESKSLGAGALFSALLNEEWNKH